MRTRLNTPTKPVLTAQNLAGLPNDVESLKALIAHHWQLDQERQAKTDRLEQALAQRSDQVVQLEQIIATLQYQIALLKRVQFGQKSERFEGQVEQLELALEDAQEQLAAIAQARPIQLKPELKDDIGSTAQNKAARQFPESLPREERVIEPAVVLNKQSCTVCGGNHWRHVGDDVSEQIELVPAHFKVIRTKRPKYSCKDCETMVQHPAPARPIAKGMAGPYLLAHMLISKYGDHLPLYRQSQIYARQQVEIKRATLADWVGSCSAVLEPLVEQIRLHVFSATKLHTDDTPVPVLQPGRKSTKEGRLWTYVRDDRASASQEPPAVWFAYSPNRKAQNPAEHLSSFTGTLQADAYAGYDQIYKARIQTDQPILEAGCWAHARRKFFEFNQVNNSPIAQEALLRIQALYDIEAMIRNKPPDERLRMRQTQTQALLDQLKDWLDQQLQLVWSKSKLAEAIRYATTRWIAMTRFATDGQLEIDNNIAERSVRPIALGKKNWMFAGSDNGGERAAAIYTLIGTCKLNGVEPEAYLAHVLERIHDTNAQSLLPWKLKDRLPEITATR